MSTTYCCTLLCWPHKLLDSSLGSETPLLYTLRFLLRVHTPLAVPTGALTALVAARPLLYSGWFLLASSSSLGRYVFGSEISYNKAPPRLPGLGC